MSGKVSSVGLFFLAVSAAQCSVCYNLLCEYTTKQLKVPSFQCLFVSVLGSLSWLCLIALLLPCSGLRTHFLCSVRALLFCQCESIQSWILFTLSSITPEMAYVGLTLSLFLLNTGDSVALFHASRLIFTAVFAPVFFSEPIRTLDALRVLACVTGVILISQPSFLFGSHINDDSNNNDNNNHQSSFLRTLGALGALFCGLCFATGNACIRGLAGSVHSPMTIMIGRFIGGSIVILIALCALMIWYDPTDNDESVKVWISLDMSDDWRLPLILVCFTVLYPLIAFLFTFIFTHGELNKVTLICSSSIATAFLFQSVLFGEVLDWFAYFGGLLIPLASVAAPIYQLCLVQSTSSVDKRVHSPHSELDPLSWHTHTVTYGLETERV